MTERRGRRIPRRAVLLRLAIAAVAVGAVAALVPLSMQRERPGAPVDRRQGVELRGATEIHGPQLRGVDAVTVGASGVRLDAGTRGPGLVLLAVQMDGSAGAAVAGATCRWFDGTGARGTAQSDGSGRISLAGCCWPVVGIARADGFAETLFWIEKPPPEEGFVSLLLEPVGSLRIAHSKSTLLSLKELDPRCDPVWQEEHERSALSQREFRLLTWAALREGLRGALDSSNRVDADALLALHNRARALVAEVESEAPRSALWALPLQLAPEWTADGVVWRDLPARLDWIWSVSKPLGTPLPPLSNESNTEDARELVLPPRLEGRTHSHTLRVPPGGERVLLLDGPGPGVIWLMVPPPVDPDGSVLGPPEGLVVHNLVQSDVDGRLRDVRHLNAKTPDGTGIVRFDNAPPGEHVVVARWRSGPAEYSVRSYLLTLEAGEARDLGPLAPSWHTSVDIELALMSSVGEPLAPQAIFVDPGSARYWLGVPTHFRLAGRAYLRMPVPLSPGSRTRLVGVAPLEVILSLGDWSETYEPGVDWSSRAELRPNWRLLPLMEKGLHTLVPVGQLERLEIRAERAGLFEVELDPWAHDGPEPWPFDSLYWARQSDLVPVSGGAVERGEVLWNAVGALARFQVPPGEYTLIVRLEPRPSARPPGGTPGLARYQGGLVYVGPVTVALDGARQRVALEPGSTVTGEIFVQSEPRLTSLHVPAELHLPSGAVARVSLQPSDAGVVGGSSAPFELTGLPPGARFALSRGQSSPSPLVVPAAGGRLDGVRVTVPPR